LPPTGGQKGLQRSIQTPSSKPTPLKQHLKLLFKTNLIERGYPETLVSITLTEITFEERKPALQQKRKQNTQILPFVTQHRPSVPDLK